MADAKQAHEMNGHSIEQAMPILATVNCFLDLGACFDHWHNVLVACSSDSPAVERQLWSVEGGEPADIAV